MQSIVEDKNDKVEDKVKIDIGCGQNKKEGFTGWDVSPKSDADLVIDVRNTPWPLDDKSVDEVHSSHFLEHLTGMSYFE